MGKRVFLTALLLCAMGMWAAPSWATCTGTVTSTTATPAPGPLILSGHSGIGTASWTIDGSTDQTSNFNTLLSNCGGYDWQLDCTNNNPYYIDGAVAGGRFNLRGCGRGNGGLKFGSSGSWEMEVACVGGVVFGGYSTVKDLFIQGTAASAFTEDSGTCGGNPASSANNVFLNFYCTGIGHCIVDHGNYNVVDHMWANNFTDSALYADGVGPIWHDIALQNGSSSHPCIYFSGASMIMNTFDINGCGGDMVIEGVTSGNACQGSSGNWNHISDGFFDAVSGYGATDTRTAAAVEIKNNSSGNCQMGSTHFSNVGFESSFLGLEIDNDSNGNSTINSVTCTNCQFHNNKNQGILVTGLGILQVRLVDSNVTSNGASYTAPTTALSANAEFDCYGCAIFLTGSSFGGDGGTPGTDPWGQSSEGPNETSLSTHNVVFNPPATGTQTSEIFISNTFFDGTNSTTNIYSPTSRITFCWNPYYTTAGLQCGHSGL